jgi:hypothetical protein
MMLNDAEYVYPLLLRAMQLREDARPDQAGPAQFAVVD